MDSSLPLSDSWRDLLAEVAAEHKLPSSGPALAKALVDLSRVYNGLEPEGTSRGRSPLAARLAFSFARDVPKAVYAVRELVQRGLLTMPADKPLRMVDVGAGLGAMTIGVAAALSRAGQSGELRSDWVDVDAEAMKVGRSVAARAETVGDVKVSVELRGASSPDNFKGQDLVVLGQVLSEMDAELEEDARADKHAALLKEWTTRLAHGGSLVVVEPALRERTRHLHRVRERLIGQGLTPFAPCLHAEACPALATKGDWCHEDRPLNLPPWLAPLAREAGLRWEGLTFAYLVVRPDHASLRASLGSPRGLVRVTSRSIVTKGKSERVLCGEVATGDSTAGGASRAAVLDRESSGREPWDAAGRGDLLVIEPPAPAGTTRLRLDATRVLAVDAPRAGK